MGNFLSNLGSGISNWWSGAGAAGLPASTTQTSTPVVPITPLPSLQPDVDPSLLAPNFSGPGIAGGKPITPASTTVSVSGGGSHAVTVTPHIAGASVTAPLVPSVAPAPLPIINNPAYQNNLNPNNTNNAGGQPVNGIGAPGGNPTTAVYQPAAPLGSTNQTNYYSPGSTVPGTNAPGTAYNPNAGGPVNPNMPTGFSMQPNTSGVVGSNEISGAPTYSDLESRVQQAYQTYAQSQIAYQQKIAADQAAMTKAAFESGDAGVNQGAQSVVQAEAAGEEAALAAPLQGEATMITAANQGLQNFFTAQSNTRANAPTFDNFQTLPTGDVIATSRDPQTGQTSLVGLGNIYQGTFNQSQPQVGGSPANPANIMQVGPNGDSGAPGTSSGGMYGTTNSYGVTVNSPQLATFANAYPTAFQFLQPGPGGVSYIDATKVPAPLQPSVQMAIANAGSGANIQYFADSSGPSSIKAADDIYDTLNQTQNLVNTTLSSGVAGAISDTFKSLVNKASGGSIYPILNNFSAISTSAGKFVTALQGGAGSGLRINSTEIAQIVNNMPTAGDSIETANTKINAIKTQVDEIMQENFPNFKVNPLGYTSTGQAGSSTSLSGQNANPADIVQTSIGAINTNW